MSLLHTERRLVSLELSWERVMTRTRYGMYADAVENRVVSHVLSQSPAPGALLDIGCEGGRRAKAFAERGWEITAVDVDAKALGVCQSRHPEARCLLVTPEERRLPAESTSIDVALCMEVAPVIHAEWAAPEFARILKAGGRLAGVCWNRASWRGFLYHNAPVLRVPGSHPMTGFPIKYADFRKEMVRRGFRFEKELGYAWGPFRRSSNSFLISPWSVFERTSGLQQCVSHAPMIAFVAQKI